MFTIQFHTFTHTHLFSSVLFFGQRKLDHVYMIDCKVENFVVGEEELNY